MDSQNRSLQVIDLWLTLVIAIFGINSLLLSKTEAIATAKFAIEPKFDLAGDFSEGLARVGYKNDVPEANGLAPYSYGYIDKTGVMVISSKFDEAGDFSEGLAWVGYDRTGDGNADVYGYIDKTGKEVIKPKFAAPGNFKSGLALVILNSERVYINKKGEVALKPKYDNLNEFREGLAIVEVKTSQDKIKCGYINPQGKLVIPLKFGYCSYFSDGLAGVKLLNQTSLEFINTKGKLVSKLSRKIPKQDYSVEFGENLASVDLTGGACGVYVYCNYGYIDSRGELALRAKKGDWTAAGKFAQGLAPVATSSPARDAGNFYPPTNWGFINRKGEFAIAPQFDYASSFSEGLARVQVKGKYGYISLPK